MCTEAPLASRILRLVSLRVELSCVPTRRTVQRALHKAVASGLWRHDRLSFWADGSVPRCASPANELADEATFTRETGSHARSCVIIAAPKKQVEPAGCTTHTLPPHLDGHSFSGQQARLAMASTSTARLPLHPSGPLLDLSIASHLRKEISIHSTGQILLRRPAASELWRSQVAQGRFQTKTSARVSNPR